MQLERYLSLYLLTNAETAWHLVKSEYTVLVASRTYVPVLLIAQVTAMIRVSHKDGAFMVFN